MILLESLFYRKCWESLKASHPRQPGSDPVCTKHLESLLAFTGFSERLWFFTGATQLPPCACCQFIAPCAWHTGRLLKAGPRFSRSVMKIRCAKTPLLPALSCCDCADGKPRRRWSEPQLGEVGHVSLLPVFCLNAWSLNIPPPKGR